jgi:hypothetical protein
MDTKVTPVLYVCNAKDCTFSLATPSTYKAKNRKGDIVETTDVYGTVSAKPGEKAICPVCGAVCNDVENGRHKFLRLNSQRIGAIREKMRLVGNTMKGAQYEPTVDDLKRVRAVLYAEFDRLGAMIDAREEKIINPGETDGKRRTVKVKRTFAL